MRPVPERADRWMRGALALLVWSALLLPVITARGCGGGPERVVHGWELALYGSEDPAAPAASGSMMDRGRWKYSPLVLILPAALFLGIRKRCGGEDALRLRAWHGAGMLGALSSALLFVIYMMIAFLFETIHIRGGYLAVVGGLGGLWLIHLSGWRSAGRGWKQDLGWNTPDAGRGLPWVGWCAWVLAALFVLAVSALLIGVAADSGLETWPILGPWLLWVATGFMALPALFCGLRLRKSWAARESVTMALVSAGPWLIGWAAAVVLESLG